MTRTCTSAATLLQQRSVAFPLFINDLDGKFVGHAGDA
jgi:hypothetical protein